MNTQLLNMLRGAAVLMIVIAGCRSADEEPGAEPAAADTTVTLDGIAFRPELPDGHRLDTIIREDLNGDGGDELIVTGMRPDSIAPADARADLLQIYTFDSLARSYRLALTDSMRWIAGIGFEQLTGDDRPDLVVRINSGGNDEIAARGMSIYSADGGKIREIYGTLRGNPVIERGGERKSPLIAVTGQYWPMFLTHAEAISYVEDYLVYRDGAFVSARDGERERYLAGARNLLGEYAKLRDEHATPPSSADSSIAEDTAAAGGAFGAPHPLFVPAARVIIQFGLAGAHRPLRSFWDSEREFLGQRLPAEEFTELEELYGKNLAGG